MDLVDHPLRASDWELVRASPVRTGCRALWAEPGPAEGDAPARRIVHARFVQLEGGATTLRRLGVREGAGYHKCASGAERDRATSLRVRIPEGAGWRTILEVDDEVGDDITWHDLGSTSARVAVIEVRRCRVDGWWPSWNLVSTGLSLEGDDPPPWRRPRQAALELAGIDLRGLPSGVEAASRNGEVRFRTRYLEVGFRLRTAAFAYLGLDDDGAGRTTTNLLQMPRSMDIVRSGIYPAGVYPVLRDPQAEYLAQGPRLTTIDGDRPLGFLATDVEGSVQVSGNQVTYAMTVPGGQELRLAWTVHEDRLELTAERIGDRPLRAWTSSAWHVATSNRVTPTHVLGRLRHEGETGLLSGPLLWHFPRFGSLRLDGSADALWRSDSVRPLETNTLELKLGEEPQPEGDYLLRVGSHRSEITLAVGTPALAALHAEAPAAVLRMVRRHAATALPFRADTATYSNNGASMHCTTTLNDLSALSVRLADPAPDVPTGGMLADSLARWLEGAPAYGSGATSYGSHRLEDEYVMLGADTLMGLARYLDRFDPDARFLEAHAGAIRLELDRARARDLDGDGLVESALRRGVADERQWSTAWYDVISCGWKDACANAVLYPALRLLAATLPRLGREDLAAGLDDWAERLRAAYLPTFLNPETGWIAGWRSADGVLHDHAMPMPNGAATSSDLVDVATGRAILRRLLAEFERVGYDDFRNGIPLNLRPFGEDEIGGVVFGLPMGCYQQGGASHHRARHLLEGLYRVGLVDEADHLLEALATTVADDSAFGGNGSGADWRMWDGTPSGYEGQLAEGFGLIATAIDRYGVRGG
jgi:hypothetical protein